MENQSVNNGKIALERGIKDTQRYFIEAIKQEPQNEQIWLLLAQTIEDPVYLRKALNKVLSLKPDNQIAIRWLAKIDNENELKKLLNTSNPIPQSQSLNDNILRNKPPEKLISQGTPSKRITLATILISILIFLIIASIGAFIFFSRTASKDIIPTSIITYVNPTQKPSQNSIIVISPTKTQVPYQYPTITPVRAQPTTPINTQGSYSNPYPFGLPAKLTQGKALFEMSIPQVVRGGEAQNIIKTANLFNEDPPDGMEYVLVHIYIKYISGTGTISFDNLSFVTLSDGQIFDWLSVGVLCCLDNAGLKELDINLALAGAQSDGWIARPVLLLMTRIP